MRSADGLSERQRDILSFIEEFRDENEGIAPSIRQIQEKLDISSTSVVAYNLKALETRGMLKRKGKISRGITLPATQQARLSRASGSRVPLLGTITAGQPLPNPEDTSSSEDMIEIPPDVATADRLQDVYALRVRGYSMIDALIGDGDIVLLRYQQTAENGQMVAARLEDENAVTLKLFYNEGGRIRLQPANVTMEPIYVDPANLRIEGRVVGVLRSMV
jgi:repressor LexA